ncbi:hypothetical protein NFC81_13460 [Salinispirillum sp. LH 10-3-1]|uniref:Histidine kinase n=1 Tax=Salinispirillum sp. LH 10-3-1 TaxID=2952525 RepID=A0AB38YEF3_9GAMM
MSEKIDQALEQLNRIENALFRISSDAPRAMSTHEVDDTVAELRALAASVKSTIESLK